MAAATPAELVAEFVGTFLLIFTIGCNVLSGSGVWAGISIACVLMVTIFAFGAVSGANFNPAVSVSLGIVGAMDWVKVGIYSAVQVGAGIAAGFVYLVLFGKSFNLSPAKDFSIWSAGACELLYTFMLCFVVLNVAAVKKGCQPWFGLAIGFVIIAGAYGAGAVSGGCFNPAVAIGIDSSSPRLGFGHCLAYTAFELVGAALAAGAFKVIRPNGGEQNEEYSMTSKLISEFLGTYILVLTVGLNVLGKGNAFSIAASLMCMIYALGDVSGANFNPAVSLALMIHGALDNATAYAYMCVQIGGGVAAAITYTLIYAGKAFPLGPGKGYGMEMALISEVAFTTVLCLVVLSVAVEKKTNSPMFFGLAIGSCVTVGGNAIGAISGGSLNPAVTLGIVAGNRLEDGMRSLIYSFFYCAAEFAGAAVAQKVLSMAHTVDEEDLAAAKASHAMAHI